MGVLIIQAPLYLYSISGTLHAFNRVIQDSTGNMGSKIISQNGTSILRAGLMCMVPRTVA